MFSQDFSINNQLVSECSDLDRYQLMDVIDNKISEIINLMPDEDVTFIKSHKYKAFKKFDKYFASEITFLRVTCKWLKIKKKWISNILIFIPNLFYKLAIYRLNSFISYCSRYSEYKGVRNDVCTLIMILWKRRIQDATIENNPVKL